MFGTRPEVIKLWPVIRELQRYPDLFSTVQVTSAQHQDLLYPLAHLLHLRIDHDLDVMVPGQTPNRVCARVLARLDPILAQENPDLVLVQGDTTTALAAALSAFHHGLPVGHVEAGLRSGSPESPFPEEMNRRLISRLASYHFAATPGNRERLEAEGIAPESIFVTGNPIVDALQGILRAHSAGPRVGEVLGLTRGLRRIVLTAHRRENLARLPMYFEAIRAFVCRHRDIAVLFPVHPNPGVRKTAVALLSGHERIHLMEPLSYPDFLELASHAWLIVSDSGGIQEEAPSLGKPLIVLRENTERPEVLDTGAAWLAGTDPEHLSQLLERAYGDRTWCEAAAFVQNPFGCGDSGPRIVRTIAEALRSPWPASVSIRAPRSAAVGSPRSSTPRAISGEHGSPR